MTEMWTPLTVTDEELRAAGYTANARNYPLSEAGARWVAAFNSIPFEKLPRSWCYAPNPYMLVLVEGEAAK